MQTNKIGIHNQIGLFTSCSFILKGIVKRAALLSPITCQNKKSMYFQAYLNFSRLIITVMVLGGGLLNPVTVGSSPNNQSFFLQPDNMSANLNATTVASTAANPLANESVNEAEAEAEEDSEEDGESPYYYIIMQAANRHNVDPALIQAMIMAESTFNPNAISKSGAKGLMQLMPRTAKALGVEDLFNPEHNIEGGTKYLRQMLDRFNGDIRLALAAYNAGTRHVLNHGGVPPFKETRRYVRKVLSYYEGYQKEMRAGGDMT